MKICFGCITFDKAFSRDSIALGIISGKVYTYQKPKLKCSMYMVPATHNSKDTSKGDVTYRRKRKTEKLYMMSNIQTTAN